MDITFTSITKALISMPILEIFAVIFGITYVVLAAKESLWAWVFAFFSTLIYTVLFWEGALISSSLLNFYYMFMAVYGFILWRGKVNGEELEIRVWDNQRISIVIISGFIVSLIIGYILESYASAKYAYLDTFVMVFSVIATWMLAQKILQNWLIWIVVDTTAVVLYWQSGYHVTIILFILYVILAFYGYLTWRKAYHEY